MAKAAHDRLRTCIAGLFLGSACALAEGVEVEPRSPRTLEDIYGDTGNRFQAAIGLQNEQARTTPEAQSAFGLAVDDVVVEWTEFTLDEDATDCAAAGACATVNLQQNNVYDGETTLSLIVTDNTPSANDCNQDGVQDVPPTRDCNGNGIDDVPVQVRWLESPDAQAVEIVIADRSMGDSYSASFAVSATYDAPGTLFVATSGAANPTIRASYTDFDDGTGQRCRNTVDAGSWGLVSHSVTLFLTPGNLVISRASFEDDVDNDGWADNSETVRMRVEVFNKSSSAFSGVTLRLSSNDPKIECITRPYLEFGDLAARERRFSDEAFEFVMSAARRSDAFQEFVATVTVSFSANEFQSPLVPQSVTFDVDLDATGGYGPSTFFESFESGFGQFTTMHLEEALNPPANDINNHRLGVLASDGYRCQYADPDWHVSGPYNSTNALYCYPANNGLPDTFYWHMTGERAFHGTQSLHYGVFLSVATGYTTPRANFEAMRTTDPINLGWANVCSVSRTTFCSNDAQCPAGQSCGPAAPEFTFKHQISMIDGRSINSQGRVRSADQGMVSLQLAAEVSGEPLGDWIRLEPFVNVYDTQANSNYFCCTFDPIDDGNTEEDFFDPTDPLRSHGPSSNCAPNFNFAFQGSTSAGNTFADAWSNPSQLGKASDGPGLAGAKGPGTWVEPVFDLSRFRGRRIRLRYMTAGTKFTGGPLWHPGFVNNTAANPDPRDDGWFVDAVTVTDTLTDPATVIVEQTTNPDAVCGDACGEATAIVAADPPATSAPGLPVALDLSASALDRCIGGVPQYQFWIDADRDGAIAPQVDLLLRDWTQEPELLDTPFGTTTYLAAVRCATDTGCLDVAAQVVAVGCPGDDELGPGSESTPFLDREPRQRRQILFADEARLVWPAAATVDFVRGDLHALRASGSFAGTVEACLLDDASATSELIDVTLPGPGEAFYYLGRSASACNLEAGGSWDTPRGDVEISACDD